MGYVRKNERNPRQEEIPDQPGVPARIAVCHPGRNQAYTNDTSCIEQGEHGNVVPISNKEITKSIEHNNIATDFTDFHR